MPNTEIEICFYEVRELNPNKFFFPNVIMNILLIHRMNLVNSLSYVLGKWADLNDLKLVLGHFHFFSLYTMIIGADEQDKKGRTT